VFPAEDKIRIALSVLAGGRAEDLALARRCHAERTGS
jgi:hypothetical protein